MQSAPRFLCDVMLARLARYLRAAGLDTALADPFATDAQILRKAIDEERPLLTADRKIMAHKAANGHVIQLPFGSLDAQAAELGARFAIDWLGNAFTRCLLDNTPLVPATPEHALLVPADVRHAGEELSACPACGRVYWRGSHYKRMWRKLAEWQEASRQTRPCGEPAASP
ncbi:MAG: Mut7-C RNAse domain-containing protein [Betaproteobacteria bacterium]